MVLMGLLLGISESYAKQDIVSIKNDFIPLKNSLMDPITSSNTSTIKFSEAFCKYLLANHGPQIACSEFIEYIHSSIDSMDQYVETIDQLFQEAKDKISSISKESSLAIQILAKDIELMHSYYKDCYDELRHNKTKDQESIYFSCITHFKKLQTSIESFRNSIVTINREAKNHLSTLDSKSSQFAYLQQTRIQLKQIADSCATAIQKIDQVIGNLANILKVYHEEYTEQRNKGLKTTRSVFAI